MSKYQIDTIKQSQKESFILINNAMSHNVLCLWLWQIGGSIMKIEEEAGNTVFYKTRTKEKLPVNDTIKVMHTSIPYVWDGADFFNAIKEAYDLYKPELVINHWTCPVGTMDRLKELLWIEVAHSPVNGKHPDLYVSIKYIFTKFASTMEAVHYLLGIGIQKVEYMRAKECELSKLLITTAYWWDILFAKMVGKMCDELWLSYNDVYTKMTKAYNEWYKALGEERFTRPILVPPTWRIWWHCVSENIELLPDITELASIFRYINN